MGRFPLWRSIFVILRVPLTIRFHDNVFDIFWCMLQDVIEISGRGLISMMESNHAGLRTRQ